MMDYHHLRLTESMISGICARPDPTYIDNSWILGDLPGQYFMFMFYGGSKQI